MKPTRFLVSHSLFNVGDVNGAEIIHMFLYKALFVMPVVAKCSLRSLLKFIQNAFVKRSRAQFSRS